MTPSATLMMAVSLGIGHVVKCLFLLLAILSSRLAPLTCARCGLYDNMGERKERGGEVRIENISLKTLDHFHANPGFRSCI